MSKPPASSKRNENQGEQRKIGGQKGHKGTTLGRMETPDEIPYHDLDVCAYCGTVLTDHQSGAQEIRQVQDLLDPSPLIVTNHIAHTCVCPGCQKTTKASFPDGITARVQYGSNLTSLVVSLNSYQLILTKRLVEAFRDLFDVSPSQGTIVNMVARCAEIYQGLARTVRWPRHR